MWKGKGTWGRELKRGIFTIFLLMSSNFGLFSINISQLISILKLFYPRCKIHFPNKNDVLEFLILDTFCFKRGFWRCPI